MLCCHVFLEMIARIMCVLTVLFLSLAQGDDDDEEMNDGKSAADGSAGGDEGPGVGADDDDEGPQVCAETLCTILYSHEIVPYACCHKIPP